MIKKTVKLYLLLSIALGVIIYLIIPLQLFNTPYATLITDKNGNLLSASIADDGQWRFPEVDSVPNMFAECIRYFEDEYFYMHPGFNPVSFARAVKQNFEAGKVVSGGSTISMQVIRLLRKNKARTYFEKLIEFLLAVKLEVQYSKKEILELYVSHAPYGGNVVGAEAASLRYFKRPLHLLSIAEYATLAVLPNAPSLIRPGKNRTALLKKRNFLLKKLYDNNVIDSLNYALSLSEKIPQKPERLPEEAFHLLDYAIKSGKKGKRVRTSIDKQMQFDLSHTLDAYIKVLSQNDIRNACAVVISLKDKKVVSYIGNASLASSGARFVDIVQRPRSSGSILKPFLYAKAIDEGLIHGNTLLRDVPISINKFRPLNFDKHFSGMVPARLALSRSLNIPAALLLKDYGIAPFYNDLQKLGFKTINRPPGNYGLTLILGGAEVSLWDLVNIYARQAIRLRECVENEPDYKNIQLWLDNKQTNFPAKGTISPGSWWLVSEMLTEVQRPDVDRHWKRFSSSRKISWKTGTSHGFRDAWAIGYNADYLVGVWVGNAEGDGRPGLTGVSAAAPLMFQFFRYLRSSHSFEKPEHALKRINLCKQSGLAPTMHCPKIELEMPVNAKPINPCKYHQKVLLDTAGRRVFIDCAVGPVNDTVWFVVDPLAGHYFIQSSADYKPLPEFSPNCKTTTRQVIDIVYPLNATEIVVPKDFDRKEEHILFEATHINRSKEIYWHIDNQFIGTTKYPHKLPVSLTIGKHTLLIMDESGNTKKHSFRVYK